MLKLVICCRNQITLVLSVDMNCPPTTKNTRTGSNERKRPKKKEEELKMLFVVVNICIFEWVLQCLSIRELVDYQTMYDKGIFFVWT